jgi:putative tricarboxylic transport membrane protein
MRHRARQVRRTAGMVATTLALTLAVTSCGVTRSQAGVDDDLLMIIPNSPGGGYDLTGRAAVRVMEDHDLTGGGFQVENSIGAGGSLAFAQLMNLEGDEESMMTVGLGVVGSLYSFGAEESLQDATPIAQLIEEQEGILVPGDSPWRTVDDFVRAWKADPSSITVGGGSSPGGPDHLFPHQLAEAVDVPPTEVNYISYDGGGPLTSALLGNKIQVGFSGLGEFAGSIENGDLRVLAVSGEERIPQPMLNRIPTLVESGIDFTFLNWRGILAPPGISEAREQQYIDYFTEMRATDEWQEQLELNGWEDAFLTGEEFDQFLVEQDARVADTLTELELIDQEDA